MDGNSDINLKGENLERVSTFKYLEPILAENGDFDAEMTHRIQSCMMENWKRVSGILCDRRISLRVKGTIQDGCNTSNDVRCRDMGCEESTREEVGCGGNEDVKMDELVTKLDGIRNAKIRGTTKVVEVSKKVQESIGWSGMGMHIVKREEGYVDKRVIGMEVSGERRRGRPKWTCSDNIRNDLLERKMSGEETQDRVQWRRLIYETSTPT